MENQAKARKNYLTSIWNRIPDSKDNIWKDNKRREVIELLCGAFWHLEIASQLVEKIDENNTLYHLHQSGLNNQLFWQEWINKRNQAPDKPLDLAADSYIVQTMFFSNSALRLSGAWEIIEEHIHENRIRSIHTSLSLPNTSTKLSRRKNIDYWLQSQEGVPQKANDWLKAYPDFGRWLQLHNFIFEKYGNEIQTLIALVVTFRDIYMHSEESTFAKYRNYNQFRKDFPHNYTPYDIYCYCIIFGETILNIIKQK